MISTLRTFLLGSTAVAALVGTRAYPDVLPQSPIMPAIVLTVIAGGSVVTHDGPAGLADTMVQVDCWADTAAARDALFDAVRKRLNGASSGTIQGIFLVRKRDLYDNDAKLYRRSADFSIWHEESV